MPPRKKQLKVLSASSLLEVSRSARRRTAACRAPCGSPAAKPQGLHALPVGVVLPHGSGKALRQPHDSCGQARTVRKQLRDRLRVAHRTGFHALGKAGAGQGGIAQLFDIFRTEDGERPPAYT
ncbi:MAG: hypothetical protein V8R85_01760 [Frisingicoccus sp.]